MKNTDAMVIDTLKEVGALLEGHFLLSSGRHSNRYCQCAQLLKYPEKAEKVLKVVADQLKDIDFDLVVGPAMGGVIVAYELGRQLGKPARNDSKKRIYYRKRTKSGNNRGCCNYR